MSLDDEEFSASHDALNRMRRAAKRGTGCNLTAEMIQSLKATIIGQMWMEDDPRYQETRKRGEGQP